MKIFKIYQTLTDEQLNNCSVTEMVIYQLWWTWILNTDFKLRSHGKLNIIVSAIRYFIMAPLLG